jgi:large subunit ribosomal protein L9
MEVILLRDVESLGQKGEVANVADGYARNFLFPRKLAQEATAGRVAAVRKVLDAKADRERREDEQAEATRDLLNKTVISIPVAVGTGDRLFGSVTNQDVADAIWAARKIRIDKRKILLSDPIKTIGTFMVQVEVHQSVDPAEIKVMVVAEGEQA